MGSLRTVWENWVGDTRVPLPLPGAEELRLWGLAAWQESCPVPSYPPPLCNPGLQVAPTSEAGYVLVNALQE